MISIHGSLGRMTRESSLTSTPGSQTHRLATEIKTQYHIVVAGSIHVSSKGWGTDSVIPSGWLVVG